MPLQLKHLIAPAFTLLFLLSSCAPTNTAISRLVLLAPFEGRYREVGYNALYAARLAFVESPERTIEFMALDDGGTTHFAEARARALAGDPSTVGVIVLGYDATAPTTMRAFADLPVLIVGNWTTPPSSTRLYAVTSCALNKMLTVEPYMSVTDAADATAPLIGGEVFALEGFQRLRGALEGVSVVSSGTLPDSDFRARYLATGLYVPEPNLLATLVYDTTRLLLSTGAATRDDLASSLETITYEGINGSISFDEAGCWENAPINRYEYVSGTLTPSTVAYVP